MAQENTVRNLAFLRSVPGFGQKLYEALTDLATRITVGAQQTNGNQTGEPIPPPQVSGVKVSGQNGYIHVAIVDNNQNLYRGIRYYAEHADNQAFRDPHIVPMHDSRNITIPVGNQTRYVRVYSAYPSSAPSAPVYHGGAVPIPVNGGGTDSGPMFLSSQGSGTGAAGEGLSGPGPIPYRSDIPGKPPIR